MAIPITKRSANTAKRRKKVACGTNQTTFVVKSFILACFLGWVGYAWRAALVDDEDDPNYRIRNFHHHNKRQDNSRRWGSQDGRDMMTMKRAHWKIQQQRQEQRTRGQFRPGERLDDEEEEEEEGQSPPVRGERHATDVAASENGGGLLLSPLLFQTTRQILQERAANSPHAVFAETTTRSSSSSQQPRNGNSTTTETPWWCIVQPPRRQQQQRRPAAYQPQNHHLLLRHNGPQSLLRQPPQRKTQQEPPPQGLFLAKTFKTASSTAAAITMRLARRIGQRQEREQGQREPVASSSSTTTRTRIASLPNDRSSCQHTFTHEASLSNKFFPSQGPGKQRQSTDRTAAESSLPYFAWTMIRQPQARALSAYRYYMTTFLQVNEKYHYRDQNNDDDDDEATTMIAYLEATKDQLVQQLRVDRPPVQEAFGILLHRAQRRRRQQKGPGHQPQKEDARGDEILGKVSQSFHGDPQTLAKWLQTQVVQPYHWIGIAERMEESIIVLLVRLGLLPNIQQPLHGGNKENLESLANAVVLSSKQQQSSLVENWLLESTRENLQRRLNRISSIFPDAATNDERWLDRHISPDACLDMTKTTTRGRSSRQNAKTTLPDAVRHYLKHNYTRDNLDELLYSYVNRSMDVTIDTYVGRERMEQWTRQLRELLTLAEQRCQPRAIFPCGKKMNNTEGAGNDVDDEPNTKDPRAKHDCYFRDMGCGYKCLDELFPP